MFTVDGIRKLHAWTHSCLNVVLDHVATIPAGDYSKELPGFGFATIQEQLIHVFNCEGFWIHTLQGLPYQDWTPVDHRTVNEAQLVQREVSRDTLAYLSGLSEQRLNSAMELHFPDGDIAVRTPALVLHHVFTHAFHHKGQMVLMCRALGYPAPATDLNHFE